MESVNTTLSLCILVPQQILAMSKCSMTIGILLLFPPVHLDLILLHRHTHTQSREQSKQKAKPFLLQEDLHLVYRYPSAGSLGRCERPSSYVLVAHRRLCHVSQVKVWVPPKSHLDYHKLWEIWTDTDTQLYTLTHTHAHHTHARAYTRTHARTHTLHMHGSIVWK